MWVVAGSETDGRKAVPRLVGGSHAGVFCGSSADKNITWTSKSIKPRQELQGQIVSKCNKTLHLKYTSEGFSLHVCTCRINYSIVLDLCTDYIHIIQYNTIQYVQCKYLYKDVGGGL